MKFHDVVCGARESAHARGKLRVKRPRQLELSWETYRVHVDLLGYASSVAVQFKKYKLAMQSVAVF